MSQEKKKAEAPKCYFNTRASPAKSTRSKLLKKDQMIPLKYQDEDEYKDLVCEVSNEANLDSQSHSKYRSGDTHDFRTKWKTEICRFWNLNGQCKYGDNCAFAHGENEMRNRKMSASYKTKKCKQFFEVGYCSYGIRCQFSHKAPERSSVSYLNLISDFHNSERVYEFLLNRPRLSSFQSLVYFDESNIEQNRQLLFDDFITVRQAFNLNHSKRNEKDEDELKRENEKRKRYLTA